MPDCHGATRGFNQDGASPWGAALNSKFGTDPDAELRELSSRRLPSRYLQDFDLLPGSSLIEAVGWV